MNFRSISIYGNFIKCIVAAALILLINISCSRKKSLRFLSKPVPPSSRIAIIIDSKNNEKNAVLITFMKKGYIVKAVNANDLYQIKDIFDIKDFKKVSYTGDMENSVISMERTYNNIYKLHIYNYEVNKAEFLNEIKNKWKVEYLILLNLKNWEEVSWGRAINLNTYELIWVENYPNLYQDNIETIVEHFISSLSKK